MSLSLSPSSPLYFPQSFYSFLSVSSTFSLLSPLSMYMCVFAHSEQRQKGSSVQLLFWRIGAYLLGLSLVAFQHQQVICREGWKQEVGWVWWRQLVEGIVWLLPLRSHQLPGPCQSPGREPQMRRKKSNNYPVYADNLFIYFSFILF